MRVIRSKSFGPKIEVVGATGRVPGLHRPNLNDEQPKARAKLCARCQKIRIPNRNKYCGLCSELRRQEYAAECYLKNRVRILAQATEFQRKKYRDRVDSRNLQGKIFGRLTVIGRGNPSSVNETHKFWACRCSCGSQITVRSSKLVSGHTTSCGCIQREKASELAKKRNGAARLAQQRIDELEALVERLTGELDKLRREIEGEKCVPNGSNAKLVLERVA